MIPAPSVTMTPRALGRSSAFFPLIGAVLGVVVGAIGVLAEPWLPRGPTVALQMIALTLLTGAVHLDGLMDAADGTLGGRTPERRLEIMRDSRVGAFGATAGILAVLLQYALLVELDAWGRLLALVAALALGRWGMAVAMALFRGAREDGLGAAYRAEAGWLPLAIATGLVVVCLAALVVYGGDRWLSAGAAGAALVGAIVLLGGRWLSGRLGGLTGDTYGALCLIGEAAVLIVAVARW